MNYTRHDVQFEYPQGISGKKFYNGCRPVAHWPQEPIASGFLDFLAF
jgi:hypothetical protein